jgi:hypothetical protein
MAAKAGSMRGEMRRSVAVPDGGQAPVACGLASTVTATPAGQIAMAGFVHPRLPPATRRRVTHANAAAIVARTAKLVVDALPGNYPVDKPRP